MSRPRVLLTGATGLIGRPTAAALSASGAEVIALSRSGRGVGAAAASLQCDLLDPDALRAAVGAAKASHLVHLAWADGADRWHGAVNLDWMAATLWLARAFAASGGRRALFVGSCAEYDWSSPMLTESSPLRPATLYGASKAATGSALMAASKALGLSIAWARPFFVYGPGEPEGRLMGDLIRGLRAGKEVPCSDGTQRRDYMYTGDLARALAAVLVSPVEGAVNVASGTAIAVRDLIAEVARQLGREDLVRLGARLRPPGDPDVIAADTGRLAREVGFGGIHDLAGGVAATLAAEAPA